MAERADTERELVNLWRVLAQRRLSRSWLARQCGVSPQYVAQIKAGIRPPSAGFRADASRVLGVEEATLFGGTSRE